jgi:dTDP-4-dehydrorhamnose 3,5-epimerase
MDRIGIEGAWLHTPRVHSDERGDFFEAFRAADLEAAAGHPLGLAQFNASISRQGVLRGVHFADVPPGQAKYITCLAGAILDVVVDVRVGSPGFGRWEAIRLDDENHRGLYVAEGLGHAFMALTPSATVAYLCSTPYTPGREHGVHPLDPGLGIAWPPGLTPILSDKDTVAPTLDQAREAGLLPTYDACLRHMDALRDDHRKSPDPAGWPAG